MTPFDKFEPQLQVVRDNIYYAWRESDGVHFQIWTAAIKQDGTGWQWTKRTSSPYDKHNPQFQVDGDKVYYAWHEADGSDFRKARYQIWTSDMNLDGTGWRAIQRTMGNFDKYTPPTTGFRGENLLCLGRIGRKKTSDLDGRSESGRTGWKAEKRTSSPYGKYDPQFQIVGSRIYYVWHEDHGPTEPIWAAEEVIRK